jgi:hypothetical protein
VATHIQAKLYSDPATRGSNVGVAVNNGVVTLSGDVPSSSAALEAKKIANGTVGVKSVQDNMTVNGAAVANQLPNAGPSPTAAAAQDQAQPQVQTNQPAPPPAPAPRPVERTIAAGAHIQVRMIDSIDSSRNTTGQTFRATLYAPLVAGRHVVIPAGAPVTVLLAQAQNAGRIKGQSDLELRVTRIDYHGHSYRVDSSVYEETGKARGKQTAIWTGIGAAAGALIGGLAGGGKGAAIGSAAGGGGGFGINMLTHNTVKIASESVLTFRLKAPLTIAE